MMKADHSHVPVPEDERPGAARRDCEPHRGHWFLFVGCVNGYAAGIWMTFAGALWLDSWVPADPSAPARLLLPYSPPVGPLLGLGVLCLPLGIVTWVLAGRDLQRMRAVGVNHGGKRERNVARWLGAFSVAAGTLSALVGVLTC